jgi:uncharacterized membrane protein YoaK (UPF0700 family)
MPPAGASPSTPASERRATQSLFSALLLTFTGGFLDAFLYLAHGRVFAGAMTGNAVFAGIALISHDSREVAHHVLPIVAFAAGIWCAFAAETRLQHHVVLVALALEAIGLFVASLLPQNFPDALFVSLVCALAGYQVGSFRKVDSFVYNATFIAGNLLRAVESLHASLLGVQPRKSKREYRDLGLVLVLFVAGAMAAASCTGGMRNHALWVPMIAVLVVLSIAIWGDLRQREPEKRSVGEPE